MFAFLSTPSGWRATCTINANCPGDDISIHALRVEGDASQQVNPPRWGHISIHALRVEGDCLPMQVLQGLLYFYPRPPGGGRLRPEKGKKYGKKFLSTPSGWRATSYLTPLCILMSYFYPRPPGGGRRALADIIMDEMQFLSTPSGWRATLQEKAVSDGAKIFLSTPSGWRATEALNPTSFPSIYFYPRPPGGGRHFGADVCTRGAEISIHALRVEGDILGILASRSHVISIHALRVEGDYAAYLYRRRREISIHALRVEGDARLYRGILISWISIHALRVEGDRTW